MSGIGTDDLRVKSIKPLLSPACLLEDLPCDQQVAMTVANGR